MVENIHRKATAKAKPPSTIIINWSSGGKVRVETAKTRLGIKKYAPKANANALHIKLIITKPCRLLSSCWSFCAVLVDI
jgi:hypothetical protein